MGSEKFLVMGNTFVAFNETLVTAKPSFLYCADSHGLSPTFATKSTPLTENGYPKSTYVDYALFLSVPLDFST